MRFGLVITISCAFFMENFDGSVLATALPSIARSLDASAVATSIGITAYLVNLAVFISLSGWLADRFGARTILMLAFVLFAGSSLGCALAHSLAFFAAARTVQGIGGAMMVPVGRLVVLKTTERGHLIKTMSLVTTPALMGSALGPPLGGFLSTFFTWRMIFLINLPVAAAGLVLIRTFVPNLRETARPFDWKGFASAGGGIALLMLGLQSLTLRNEHVWFATLLIVPGTLLVLGALAHARRHPEGLVDLSLLRYSSFARGIAGGALFFVSMASMPFLLPLLLQLAFHMTAFTSGLLMLAAALGGLFMKRLAPTLLKRFGFRKMLIETSFAVAIAMILCATISGYVPLVLTASVLFCYGLLRSLQFAALNTLVYADVPVERSSRATSLADTLKQLWQGVGVTAAAILLRGLNQLLPAAGPLPLESSMVLMALLGLSAILVFRRLSPDAGAGISGHQR